MATAAAPSRPPLPLYLSSSRSSSKPSNLHNFRLKNPNPNLTLKKTLTPKFPELSISAAAAAAAAGGGNQSGGGKKEQKLTSEGLVTEALPNCMFRVKLENGDEILGYLSGKMQKNKIFIVPGDRVEIEVGKYDSTRGRITFRRDSRARRPTGGKDQKTSSR